MPMGADKPIGLRELFAVAGRVRPARGRREVSAFDQSNFSGTWAFAGLFGRELDALTFTQ